MTTPQASAPLLLIQHKPVLDDEVRPSSHAAKQPWTRHPASQAERRRQPSRQPARQAPSRPAGQKLGPSARLKARPIPPARPCPSLKGRRRTRFPARLGACACVHRRAVRDNWIRYPSGERCRRTLHRKRMQNARGPSRKHGTRDLGLPSGPPSVFVRSPSLGSWCRGGAHRG